MLSSQTPLEHQSANQVQEEPIPHALAKALIDKFYGLRERAPTWTGLAATLALVLFASILSVLLRDRLGVPRVGMIYILAIIAMSAVFGTRQGLICAIASVLAYGYFLMPPFWEPTFAATRQYIFNVTVFAGAAVMAGTYANALRASRTIDPLIAAAAFRTTSTKLGGLNLEWTGIPVSKSFAMETMRVALAILIVALTAVLARVLQLWLGEVPRAALLLTAIGASGILMGSRPALIAAIFGAFAFDYFFVGAPNTLDLTSSEDIIIFPLFVITGWVAGSRTERISANFAAMEIALSAEHGIFSAPDDASVHRALLAATKVIVSEADSLFLTPSDVRDRTERWSRLPETVKQMISHSRFSGTEEYGRWRMHALDWGGRTFGFLIWISRYRDWWRARRSDANVGLLADAAAMALLQLQLRAERMDTDLAARAERLRSAVLSAISHDFRTPLTGILGSVTGLMELGEAAGSSQQKILLSNIKSQAIRLNRYVDNLLGVVRVDAGALKARQNPIDLEQIVYEAWESLDETGADQRILDVRLESNPIVLGDGSMLLHVLINVFDNAIKFSPVESSIAVRSRVTQDHLSLTIADEGRGVSENELSRIFGRLYRAEGQETPGSGLGLFIARTFVEAMGGTISAGRRDDGNNGLEITINLRTAGGSP